MKKIIIALSVGFILLGFSPALASTFASGDSYNLPSGQTLNSNLYTAGGNINLSGTVNGDAFAAGGTIMSMGKISNDLNAAGGNIIVSGQVGDDLRVAGGSISVSSKVGGEALMAGGQVVLTPEAVINKDLTTSGGTVILNGIIDGNVLVYGQKVELLGTVNGNVKAMTAELVLDPKTIIKGTLSYSAPSEVQVPSGAQIGKIDYTKHEFQTKNAANRAAIGGFWFYKVIAGIVVALILYFVFRRGTTNLITGSLKKFWTKVLFGFAALILIPIAGIIVAVTFVGLPLSIMTALIYLLFFGLSTIGAGAVFGTWIFSLFNRTNPPQYRITWVTITVGIIVLSIIAIVPFLGWLVAFIFTLALLGEMWHQLYHGLVKIR